MLTNFDDQLREIADNFAEVEKKGELLQILKQLKKDIMQATIHKITQGFDAAVNDIEVHHLDKGVVVQKDDKSE